MQNWISEDEEFTHVRYNTLLSKRLTEEEREVRSLEKC